MSKEYFPHDFHARSNLRDICRRFGMEGYGFFWGFVEILHESGGYVKESELASIAYELRVSEELCQFVVKESGFFVNKKGKITSKRVLENLKKVKSISDARRTAANKRWNGEREDTNGTIDELEAFEEQRLWFEKQITKFEDTAGFEKLYGEDATLWGVRPLFFNLMDELKNMEFVVVEHKKIPLSEYLNIMTYFFRTREGIESFCRIVHDVDGKVKKGRVKNKKNYLLSALFLGAKIEGAE